MDEKKHCKFNCAGCTTFKTLSNSKPRKLPNGDNLKQPKDSKLRKFLKKNFPILRDTKRRCENDVRVMLLQFTLSPFIQYDVTNVVIMCRFSPTFVLLFPPVFLLLYIFDPTFVLLFHC